MIKPLTPDDLDAIRARLEAWLPTGWKYRAKMSSMPKDIAVLLDHADQQQRRIVALEAAMNAYSLNTTLRYKGEFYPPGEWPGKPEGYPDGAAS